MNALSLVQRPQLEPSARNRALEVLGRQLAHQGRLVDDLLDVSRISRGSLEVHLEPLDLGALVRNAAEDHRPALQAAGLDLILSLPAHPVPVLGDPTRLSQVVGNLLHNATKFSEGRGPVRVSLELDRRLASARVSVADQGIGIPADLLPRVFETFIQGPQSLARVRGGLGLGLALVKGLIELHGGEVAAYSEGPSRGARLEFTVPVTAETAPVPRAEAAPSTWGASRVLIVEDNEDAAETLRDLLELDGHEVELAFTGPDGIAAARRFHPDVILCDLGLPGCDGYEVARTLRADPLTLDVRLVVVSGYGADSDRARCREAGFDEHLTKPVSPERLRQALAERS